MDLDIHTCFPRGLIQVAGVRGPEEARLLLDCGVDLIGLPLRLPVHEADLTEAEAVQLACSLPGRCCLITYPDRPGRIIELARRMGIAYLQLHGNFQAECVRQLGKELPGVRFFKSLVVGRDPEADLFDAIRKFETLVSAFITDTYDPASGAEGATGQPHDWAVSRRLREATRLPLILAGGLNPGTVAQAIRAVEPFGVDVHSGVEGADGSKDPGKVAAFVQAARTALLDGA